MLSLAGVIIIAFILVLYIYLKRVYFTLHGPLPGIAPQFFFGNLLQTGIIGRNESFFNVFRILQNKFGDVFQFWLSSIRMIVVCRLEDIQHIFAHRHQYEQAEIFAEKMHSILPNSLVCLTGHAYKRRASITHPLFRRMKFHNHLDTIIDYTDKLLNRWRTTHTDPKYIHLDLINQMRLLVLDIFSFIFFDYDFQTTNDENGSRRDEFNRALYTVFNSFMFVLKCPTILGRLYLFFNFNYRHARQLVDQYLNRIIDEELQETPLARSERKTTSLIASLVASMQKDEKIEARKPEEEKKGLSREEVLDEMLTFLIAGFGATVGALAWFIHLMSLHPHIQHTIKKTLAETNLQSLTIDQLDSLVYLDCVLQEMFRFIAPTIGTMRSVIVDDRLPSTGVELKKGDLIFIPIPILGRDPRYWPGSNDPDQFYPERFLVERNEIHNPMVPFGGGHRQCVGQDLARFIIKIICTRLIQHVTFGDGGPQVNSGDYLEDGDAIIPKHIGVTITFDIDNY